MSACAETTSNRTIEAVTLLRLCRCSACNLQFAVPISFVAALAKAGQDCLIHCPAGHATRATLEAESLGWQLEQARFENLQLRRQINEGGAPQSLPLREVRRRATLRAERAECVEYGQVLCPYCANRKKSRATLRSHIYRQHLEDLKFEPAEVFQ